MADRTSTFVVAQFLLLVAAPSLSVAGTTVSASGPFLWTTWTKIPADGYFYQPLTELQATDEGWFMFSDCGDSQTFTGRRYLHPDFDLVLIYDIGGVVAGVQCVVPKVYTDEAAHDYAGSPYYMGEVLPDGTEVWLLTVYFVQPTDICDGGNVSSSRDLDADGVVRSLHLQRGGGGGGPTWRDGIVDLPLTEDEMKRKAGWYEQACFLLMGTHYLSYDYDVGSPCMDIPPLSVLYNEGVASGVVFNLIATVPGRRYEFVGRTEALLLFPLTAYPDCVSRLAEQEGGSGMRSVHVFFGPHVTDCRGAAHPSALNGVARIAQLAGLAPNPEERHRASRLGS